MNPLNHGIGILFVMALFIGMQSCNDPTSIGAELLEEDQANVGFSDTITLKATTILSDTIRTYSPSAQIRSYLFGDMTDPIFGRSKSELYLEARLSFLQPDFFSIDVDSVVLVLPYDTASFFGIWQEEFGLDVFEMFEKMDRTADYNSDVSFMTDAVPMGSYTFTPNPDTLTVIDYSSGFPDTVSVVNQLRLPLDPELGTRLTRLDSASYQSDSAFIEVLNGIYLQPTLGTNGLISFDLFNSPDGGIFLYYTQNDTVPLQYHYQFNPFSAKVASFEHEITGTIVETAVNDADPTADLVFSQGMAGVDVKIELPDLSYLQNSIINKAEIELSIAPVDGDDTDAYSFIPQLVLGRDNDDQTDRVVIEDIEIITLRGLDLGNAFGGQVLEGDENEPSTYLMNIAAYLQNYIETGEGSTLYLSAFPKANMANRTIFYGTSHPEFGVKLKIAYTEL
ncbi:MAG: DUF4270 domain-containing protein [Saprospiraceae bacterium]|jgi:hypothetical protein|nr:DUF4270 domain-containing protein [Saprospiraceae bacterium]